ncbi:MAG: hypothetical protein N3F10_01100 [Candidatus Bathyarchaeota archaeon]|nr:hypothetical protein [Candidatus Bathyarchaeota archaeon]
MSMNPVEWLLMPQAPGATVTIMMICALISFFNYTVNRLLITHYIGWDQYRRMMKEISEYRALVRQAMSTRDKKLLEKLKKKEPQIMNMQSKMAKPQMLMYLFPLIYILIWWFGLLPFYGTNPVAYVPGIGRIPVLWWYFLASLLFSTLASRLLGMMPIE